LSPFCAVGLKSEIQFFRRPNWLEGTGLRAIVGERGKALNGHQSAQFGFDFRTQRATAVDYWSPCASQRAACTPLNRERANGILEAAQCTPSRESFPVDVWNATFATESAKREIPLISLPKMGIWMDADGMLSSNELRQLRSGAEAYPFADDEAKVVYKLFNLRANGSLGKKVILRNFGEERSEITLRDATLPDTLEKLAVLNEAGAHPTEIVGLSDDGNFLIAKQPLAHPYEDFKKDRLAAMQSMKALIPSFTRLNREIAVFWLNNRSWIICDLHNGNVMKDRERRATIIDALIGPLPTEALEKFRWAREIREDCQTLRLGKIPAKRFEFGDDVDDDAL
jgi:hypothetical protein